MKKSFILIAAVIGILSLSCPEPDDVPENKPANKPVDTNGKTLIVFDNTQGICAASVYEDSRRRAEDKIADIPAGRVSDAIEWSPGDKVPFYFSYTIRLKGIGGLTLNYVPKEIGKDQKIVRIDAEKKNTVTIPKLTETVSSPNEPLSNNSYLLIQNNSSFSFQLHQGSSIISPDNSSVATVNSEEQAQYTITPGPSSSYQLLVGADYKTFPSTTFKAGYVYSYIYYGSVSLITEIEITLENVTSVPTPGLYKGEVKIGTQNLAASLDYISKNAVSGDNFSIVLGANESSPPNNLSYTGKTVGITLIGYGDERTITLTSNGSLFTVNSGVTLTLDENITIKGLSENNNSLVYINNGKLNINTGAKITGNNNYTSLSGGGVYMMGASARLTMNGGEVSGNTVTASSGNCRGGGMYVYSGTIVMNGGEISGNTANGNGTASGGGGGIFVSTNANFTMNGGAINGNTATSSSGTRQSYGGGVYLFGTFTMNGGAISGNTAPAGFGGGVETFGIFTMHGGEISDNSAAKSPSGNGGAGGGVDIDDNGSLTIDGGKISGNTASYGGGVDVGTGTLTMKGGEISGNVASNSGGGVYNEGTFTIETGKISGNSSSYGGGIYLDEGTITMKNGEISGNTAIDGGGVDAAEGTFTMNGGEISGNTASTSGGGIYTDYVEVEGIFYLKGGKISGNTAVYGGGACVFGSFSLDAGEISGNTTSVSGGGVYVGNEGTLAVNDGKISGNTASNYGGGVYVDREGIFAKVGGTITGYTDDNANGNKVNNINGKGHAVYINSTPANIRDTTAGPGVDYEYNTTVSEPNQTPTVLDYNIGNLTQTVGSVTAVTITPKDGKSSGARTIYYSGTGGTTYTKSTTLPTAGGTYAVTFDVAAVTGWNEAKGLSAGTLTISAAVNNSNTFTSVSAMTTWLSTQTANTAANPYTVKLNVNDVSNLVDLMNQNVFSGKYVSLDLSGSTFTGINGGDYFKYLKGLTSITISSSVTSIETSDFSGCTDLTAINVDAANAAYSSQDGVVYNKNKTVLIAYPAGKTGAFTIPGTVTGIGQSAFQSCANLSGVTIPGSVTSIGSYAFSGCTSLTSVTIPSGVTSIGAEAFYGCTSLTSVTIPSTVTNIGSYAFSNCTGLTSVTFQGTIPSANFGNYSFPGDLRDKYLAVTDGGIGTYTRSSSGTTWTKQNGNVFTSAADMTTWLSNQPTNTASKPYTITLNVNTLGGNSDTEGSIGYALQNSYSKYISLDLSGSTFTAIEEKAFYFCSRITDVTLPNTVITIESQAFYYTGLTSVTIPNSVTSIGDSAFGSCYSLTSVSIGNGVTSIGNNAFSYCTNLTAINVDTANTAYSSQDGILYNKNNTSLIRYPQGKTVAFTIPNSVTSIGSNAFANCANLTGVSIPNTVTSIGAYAFNSSGLASITIPNSVTSIGDNAFTGCKNLTAINVDAANTAYSSQDGVLYNKNKTTLLVYPTGKTGAFIIPSGVTTIKSYAFSNCTNLTGVTIPSGVTTIESFAFYGCTNLTSVTIPSTVTSMWGFALSGCTNLTSVTFQGTIPSSGFSTASNFDGDLRSKFYATNTTNGTPGTYNRTSGTGSSAVWEKQ